MLDEYNPLIEEVIEKKPIYFIGNEFQPIEQIAQGQLLTNSVVFNQLPEQTLQHVQETTQEDIDFLKK